MSSESDSSCLPTSEGWQAGTLRLTSFPDPDARIGEPTWWQKLVGDPPETRTSKPRQGQLREEGPFEGGKLALQIQPGRIDWLFVIDEKLQDESEGVVTLGPLSSSMDTFTRLMRSWFSLDTCPSARRLALGAVLLQPVEDHQVGYRTLSNYLPFSLDAENSSDFQYQINRPRPSKNDFPGLRMNRLSKWAVAAWSHITLSLGLQTVQASSRAPTSHACRLELDINTAPDYAGEFDRAQLSVLMDEMTELACEVSTKGDIP